MVFFLGVFLFFLLATLYNVSPQSSYIVEFFVLSLTGKDFFFVFFWDMMSYLFSTVVLMIAFVVFIYSIYYMDTDKSRFGFMLLLLSFVTSMLFLLTSPHLISMLLGWDGLGLTSYLLVLYYSSSSSSTAAMVTFLTNRLGDVFFLMAIGAFSFFFDWELVNMANFLLMGLLLLLAFSTKSAQVPFSAWLPAAMAAPTPVSSLVHSSTLVTAGLYLMIRFYTVLMGFNSIVLMAGVITLLAAGLMAFFEWDLKKLIAFSTLSQLGFMVSAYAMGLVWVSFFHLLTHALFKASLFLSAGVLIHNADNSQEFRNMFVVPFQLFWVSGVVNLCLMCLCGVPFTSGFYSKDLIVDGGTYSFFLFMGYMAGVGFTIIYSSRFFFFSHRTIQPRFSFSFVYEKVWVILVPIISLVMLALVGGWLFLESFFSFKFFVLVASGWKVCYFMVLFIFLFMSYALNKTILDSYKKKFFFSSIWYLKNFCSSKFWKVWFRMSMQKLSYNDQGILENLGPQGVFKIFMKVGLSMFSFQSFLFVVYFLPFLLAILVL